MAAGQTAPGTNGHAAGGLVGRLATHWLTGLFLGFIGWACFALLQAVLPLAPLERLGADAANGHAASRPQEFLRADQPPLVIVAIDRAAMSHWQVESMTAARPRIAETIQAVRRARPAVVAVDIGFEDRRPHADAIRTELERPGPPIVVVPDLAARRAARGLEEAAQVDARLGDAYPAVITSHLHFGSEMLVTDPDGVVRGLPPAHCILWVAAGLTGPASLPSLAHAAVAIATLREMPRTDCPRTAGWTAQPFMFLLRPEAEVSNWLDARLARHVLLISAHDAPYAASRLEGAIVLIGEVNPDRDTHATPLGAMSGTLVHANAILSLLHVGPPGEVPGHWKWGLKVGLVVMAATLWLLYWLFRELTADWLLGNAAQRVLRALLHAAAFCAVGALVIGSVAVVAVTTGAEAWVLGGAALASLVPAMAVLLETVVEAGKPLLALLHDVAHRIIGSAGSAWRWATLVGRRRPAKRASAVVVLLLCGAAPVSAQGPTAAPPFHGFLRVDAGDPAGVGFWRDGAALAVTPWFEVRPRDQIHIRSAGTKVAVYLPGADTRTPSITLEHPANYVVPERSAAPAASDVGPVWDLMQRIRRREPQRLSPGGTRAEIGDPWRTALAPPKPATGVPSDPARAGLGASPAPRAGSRVQAGGPVMPREPEFRFSEVSGRDSAPPSLLLHPLFGDAGPLTVPGEGGSLALVLLGAESGYLLQIQDAAGDTLARASGTNGLVTVTLPASAARRARIMSIRAPGATEPQLTLKLRPTTATVVGQAPLGPTMRAANLLRQETGEEARALGLIVEAARTGDPVARDLLSALQDRS